LRQSSTRNSSSNAPRKRRTAVDGLLGVMWEL
jgi:hypothetical protein